MVGVLGRFRAVIARAQEHESADLGCESDWAVNQMKWVLSDRVGRHDQLPPGVCSNDVEKIMAEFEQVRDGFAKGWDLKYSPDDGYYYAREFPSQKEAAYWWRVCNVLRFGEDYVQEARAQGIPVGSVGDQLGRSCASQFVTVPQNVMDTLCKVENLQLQPPGQELSS